MAAYDLTLFFAAVAKLQDQVGAADVLAFITARRTGQAGERGALYPVTTRDEPSGVSAATVRRLAPLLFGAVCDYTVGGGTGGLRWTLVVMLLLLAAAAFFLVPGRRHYPADVAAAAVLTRRAARGGKGAEDAASDVPSRHQRGLGRRFVRVDAAALRWAQRRSGPKGCRRGDARLRQPGVR